MHRPRSRLLHNLVFASAVLLAPSAHALPGLFVGKGDAKRIAPATHVVIAAKGDVTVVTVMPEYSGPLTPFALVLPVPGDVTIDRIKPMKREFVDRMENLTAPRYHEWWEEDPCDPAPPEQEWERNLKVQGGGFLAPDAPGGGGAKKKVIAKEMILQVDPVFMQKESEYTCSMLSPADAGNPTGYLTGKGYKVPGEASAALGQYVKQGMNLVVCEVDTAKVALVAGDRAQLAGIRYWSERPARKLPLKLGLSNADKMQDVFIYVLDPEKRWEAKNYKNYYPPTNTEIEAQLGDVMVKERPSEYYNGITDLILAKHPDAFLLEYAWGVEGCGMPCPNEPLLIHEMMSLGGDILDEKTVPEAERFPAPPEETDEEKEAFKEELKELKTYKEKQDAKKEREEERKEIARRKALLARQKYMISRLHYRYSAATLTRDPEVGPAAKQIEGGIGNPKGLPAELPQGVKEINKPSRYQVRFGHFHKWKSETMACEKPMRGRWGKRWSELRIWNHIWVADALSRKRRDELKLTEVVRTPIAELGLPGKPFITDAGADGGTDGGKRGKGCGCTVPGTRSRGASLLALGLALVPFVRRRARPR